MYNSPANDKSSKIKQAVLKIILTAIIWLVPLPGHAVFFRLDGDRLWLQADQVPLADVLGQFTQLNVVVQVDPDIRETVQAAFRGVNLDDALNKLLDPYDYVITWKMLRGPLGRVPKLQKIEVYRPGNRQNVRPLPQPPARFQVTRGVAGNQPEFIRDELLVGTAPGTTYAQFKALMDQVGGMIVDAEPGLGIYLIRFPAGVHVENILERLARHPLIAHAELNYAHRLPPPPERRPSVQVRPKIAPPADGSVPVAVLDSGLDPAIGIGPLVTAAWDAVAPEQALSDPSGHGTQMALLASGVLAADGLQPGATLLPLVAIRSFDDQGVTSNFALFQALAYAAEAGARVVNLSWGSETDTPFLREAVERAAAQGLLVVAAAGNQPSGRPVYPAAYSSVIAVGGIDSSGQPWTQSNHGTFVDLSAPAFATLPSGSSGAPGSYVGTSISAATVAHALGQYLNRHPTATAREALKALQDALTPPSGPNYGKGILDHAALQRLLAP